MHPSQKQHTHACWSVSFHTRWCAVVKSNEDAHTHTRFVIFLSFRSPSAEAGAGDTPCHKHRCTWTEGGVALVETHVRAHTARMSSPQASWLSMGAWSPDPLIPPAAAAALGAATPRFDAARHVRVAHGLYPCFDTLAAAPTTRGASSAPNGGVAIRSRAYQQIVDPATGPCPSWANACATSDPFQLSRMVEMLYVLPAYRAGRRLGRPNRCGGDICRWVRHISRGRPRASHAEGPHAGCQDADRYGGL